MCKSPACNGQELSEFKKLKETKVVRAQARARMVEDKPRGTKS